MKEHTHGGKVLADQKGFGKPPRATRAAEAALVASAPGDAFLLTPALAPDPATSPLLARDAPDDSVWEDGGVGALLDSSDEQAVHARRAAHPRSGRDLISAPAFDFEQARFDFGEVLLAALAWGEWQRLERTVAEGAARVAAAEASGERLEESTIADAVTSFRRAHGLLAGEHYQRWLADRSLSGADVAARFARALLRRRSAGHLDELRAAHPPEAAIDPVLISNELKLGGWLHSWAWRLARCAGAERSLELEQARGEAPDTAAVAGLIDLARQWPRSGLSETQARVRASRVLGLLIAERAFRERCATPEQIAACIASHRLDWQRLVWEEARFPSQGAAREAALCVREEALTLEEVASRAHGRAQLHEAYCNEEPALAPSLAGALPAELVGPLEHEGAWSLFCLRERKGPDAADSKLRELARTELFEEALERHMAGRLSWHGEH